MIRLLLILVMLIILISLFSAGLAKWLDMYREGYSRNPLKWAQERRWRENASRQVRITRLEHDLGLHADRAEVCIDCDNDKRRAFDQKWLSNEPFDLPYRRRGTSSGGPR
jgi:hypothetical protein